MSALSMGLNCEWTRVSSRSSTRVFLPTSVFLCGPINHCYWPFSVLFVPSFCSSCLFFTILASCCCWAAWFWETWVTRDWAPKFSSSLFSLASSSWYGWRFLAWGGRICPLCWTPLRLESARWSYFSAGGLYILSSPFVYIAGGYWGI